jgi:predicted ester cyclase
MSPVELKALVRRIPEEMFTQGDLAVADAVFAPNLIHHGLSSLAPGIAGAKQFTRILRQAFPDLYAIVEDEIAEGDQVVQRLILGGTHRGMSCGIPPTSTRATWQQVIILRLGSDGKVAEYWSSPDLVGVMHQVGTHPPTAPPLGLDGIEEDIG